jgi:Protein of unknown function (DUF541)
MRTLTAAAPAALAGVAVIAAVAAASGGPPPQPPSPPAPRTVVAVGTGIVDVERPQRRTDATIGRAVAAARAAAIPRAVAAARAEATRLAQAAGLTLSDTIGVSRDAPPPGYWEPDTGRFGPGRWCGSIRRRRDAPARRSCQVPREISLRVTLTVAAG